MERMKMNATRIVFAVAMAAAGGLAIANCSDTYPTLSDKSLPKAVFKATLDGASERPTPVTTTASGKGTATLIPTYRDTTLKVDTNIVRVEVLVSTIDSVTQAHIHAGDASTAGPIMVFILSNVAAGRPPITGTDRVLTQLDITRTTAFTAPYTFDSLLARIKAGTAYVNVHTRKNPGGEIRGQIVP
jgi:hypothetical protein